MAAGAATCSFPQRRIERDQWCIRLGRERVSNALSQGWLAHPAVTDEVG
jgi:hypothetical protein